MKKSSAERINWKGGTQYHIGLKQGEAGDYILLCGDPERVEKVAAHFDKVTLRRQHREYVTASGTLSGKKITAMGTGIGPDNTEIAVVELSQIVRNPTFIRIGSTGSLQPYINLGDLVITTGAVRLENTTNFFVPEGYPAIAHIEVVTALANSAKKLKFTYHVGITATAPGFYGAQGRNVPGFKPRFPDLWKQLAQINVLNLEMEASTLLTLAAMRGFRAGVICAVYSNRPKDEFISPPMKEKAEADAIAVAIEAITQL